MRSPASRRAGTDPRFHLRSVGLLVVLALILPSAASAAEGEIELALRPVDQREQYFDVEMDPGETRTLEVELANVGDAGLEVRTYAADVYTIINGGFGARLRDEPQSGTTLWVDYATDLLDLPAGRGIRRTFQVHVPADATPGEYITSLVLENEAPTRGGGDVAVDQVVRQAVAVAVTVPGRRAPALSIGSASHKAVAGRSVLAVELSNDGNVRLKPIVEVVLRDGRGGEVSRATVPMDTFYPRTGTHVEVPLAALLQPGRYTVDVVVEAASEGARAEAAGLELVVDAAPAPGAPGGAVPPLTEVFQGPAGAASPGALVAGAALVALFVGLLVAIVRRRQRKPALR